MKEQKRKLRKWIASEKTKYCDSTLDDFSDKTLSILEAHPLFREAHTVLLYHSLKDEVNTHGFIERWKEEKKIVLPVVVSDNLELRVYTGMHNMIVGSYGIAEPGGETFSDYDSIDLAVIPGIAFDRSGGRLGRGKGYYDKLLPSIKASKIGICFPFQLIEEVPVDSFDIRMDLVLAFNER